jgi:hypothetical protein
VYISTPYIRSASMAEYSKCGVYCIVNSLDTFTVSLAENNDRENVKRHEGGERSSGP